MKLPELSQQAELDRLPLRMHGVEVARDEAKREASLAEAELFLAEKEHTNASKNRFTGWWARRRAHKSLNQAIQNYHERHRQYRRLEDHYYELDAKHQERTAIASKLNAKKPRQPRKS